MFTVKFTEHQTGHDKACTLTATNNKLGYSTLLSPLVQLFF